MSWPQRVDSERDSLDGWWSPIVEALAQEPHVAARLVVEITETAPLTDMEAVRDFVKVLQLLGCRVALDDVGAGYSSAKSLTELGVDIVKVDGSYVQNARSNKLASARVRTLIDLARERAARVVLEGIEREEDLQLIARVRRSLGPRISVRAGLSWDTKTYERKGGAVVDRDAPWQARGAGQERA